jgi:hypothetical protein
MCFVSVSAAEYCNKFFFISLFHFQIFVFSKREKVNESKLDFTFYSLFFSNQQDVFAHNWPIDRYREKHFNSFCLLYLTGRMGFML